jgi:hypothetical protein
MKKPKPPGAKYMARAQALAEAIDIGMPLFRPMTEAERETVLNPASNEAQIASNRAFCLDIRQKALSPEPPFATLRSLAYLEEAFFTAWNEGLGEHVEQFWQRIAERGLPFERRDLIREILTRRRIRNDIEYQAVTDALVVLQHIGKITDREVAQLAEMLEAFEKRAPRRPRGCR